MTTSEDLRSAATGVPSGVPIDDPVDQAWEQGLDPKPVERADRAAHQGRSERADSEPSQTEPRGLRGLRSRPLATVAAAWRQLTSMRTALLLLFLLALAAVPGSLLPQRSVNPLRVQQYLDQHRTLGPFLDRLSGFSVFAAPWFSAIYVLLMVSLVGCVVPRLRLHARTMVRRPPKAPAHPSRLSSGTSWTVTAAPQEAVAEARAVLRRARFRAYLDGDTVAAEKGQLRETGNLLFHFSLIGVLIGVAVGSLFGYSGSVLIPEGRSFTNTLVAYDAFTPGARVDPAKLQPFSFRLNAFTARYQPSGEPAAFAAAVDYRSEPGAPAQPAVIRVNEPLKVGQTKVYLTGHGYAPHFLLRDARGRVLFDDYVPCTPRSGSEPASSTCTVKVPDAGLPPVGPLRIPQQLAFRAGLNADPAHGSPVLNNPQLVLSSFVGDLHLDEGVPQNVYSLDMSGLKPVRTDGPAGRQQLVQALNPADPSAQTLTGLPGGLTLTVDGVRNWSVFAMKHDPGKGIVLLAAVLLLAGLITSLTVRRRRVWVRATAQDNGRTLVEIGGLARTGDLSAEFDELAGRLRERLAAEGKDSECRR